VNRSPLRLKQGNEHADPAAAEGSETEKWVAFRSTFQALDNRIKIFTSLPLASLDRIKLQERLDAIGKTPAEPPR
jgi:hypothetical protein